MRASENSNSHPSDDSAVDPSKTARYPQDVDTTSKPTDAKPGESLSQYAIDLMTPTQQKAPEADIHQTFASAQKFLKDANIVANQNGFEFAKKDYQQAIGIADKMDGTDAFKRYAAARTAGGGADRTISGGQQRPNPADANFKEYVFPASVRFNYFKDAFTKGGSPDSKTQAVNELLKANDLRPNLMANDKGMRDTILDVARNNPDLFKNDKFKALVIACSAKQDIAVAPGRPAGQPAEAPKAGQPAEAPKAGQPAEAPKAGQPAPAEAVRPAAPPTKVADAAVPPKATDRTPSLADIPNYNDRDFVPPPPSDFAKFYQKRAEATAPTPPAGQPPEVKPPFNPVGADGKPLPPGPDGKPWPVAQDGKPAPFAVGQDGKPVGQDGKPWPVGGDGKPLPPGPNGQRPVVEAPKAPVEAPKPPTGDKPTGDKPPTGEKPNDGTEDKKKDDENALWKLLAGGGILAAALGGAYALHRYRQGDGIGRLNNRMEVEKDPALAEGQRSVEINTKPKPVDPKSFDAATGQFKDANGKPIPMDDVTAKEKESGKPIDAKTYDPATGQFKDADGKPVDAAKVEVTQKGQKLDPKTYDPVTKTFRDADNKPVPEAETQVKARIGEKKDGTPEEKVAYEAEQTAKAKAQLELELRGRGNMAPILDTVGVAVDTNLRPGEKKLVLQTADGKEFKVEGATQDGKLEVSNPEGVKSEHEIKPGDKVELRTNDAAATTKESAVAELTKVIGAQADNAFDKKKAAFQTPITADAMAKELEKKAAASTESLNRTILMDAAQKVRATSAGTDGKQPIDRAAVAEQIRTEAAKFPTDQADARKAYEAAADSIMPKDVVTGLAADKAKADLRAQDVADGKATTAEAKAKIAADKQAVIDAGNLEKANKEAKALADKADAAKARAEDIKAKPFEAPAKGDKIAADIEKAKAALTEVRSQNTMQSAADQLKGKPEMSRYELAKDLRARAALFTAEHQGPEKAGLEAAAEAIMPKEVSDIVERKAAAAEAKAKADAAAKAAPVEAPAEAPKAAPVEAPAEAPKAAPVEAPAEAPKAAPVEAPAEAPKAAPVEAPAEAPKAAPVEAPAEAPKAAPVEAPAEAPKAAPVEAPAEAPKAAPVEAPAEAPKAAPVEAPAEAPKAAPTADELAKERIRAAEEAAKAVPAEAPKAAPVEAPAEAPKAAPVEAPAEAPKAAPVEAPAEAPKAAPVEAPAEAPKAAPVEAPAEAPKAAPVEAPAEAPKAAPVEARRRRGGTDLPAAEGTAVTAEGLSATQSHLDRFAASGKPSAEDFKGMKEQLAEMEAARDKLKAKKKGVADLNAQIDTFKTQIADLEGTNGADKQASAEVALKTKAADAAGKPTEVAKLAERSGIDASMREGKEAKGEGKAGEGKGGRLVGALILTSLLLGAVIVTGQERQSLPQLPSFGGGGT